MKLNRSLVVALALTLLSVLVQPAALAAAEITVLCSNGIKAVMEDLVPKFEKATGHKVIIDYNLAAVLKQKIEGGTGFDLAILTPPLVDDLIKQGKMAADSRTMLARSGLGLLIRTGGHKRDISTTDAFKRTLLEAKSIAYAKVGASGVYFAELVQKLGVADTLKSKSRLTATGEEVGESVARGEVELGVLPLSEILPVKGAELLGMFPADVQSYIVMTAGVSAGAKQGQAARELIKFVTAPAALPVIKAKGMERG
jgi:molybdate transport system substrate-binding protein